ncbi:MAG: hypothetical protein HY343_02540 [Lentisphaerae bacterium]|nr:hypothetical protein [Lentisphaerota bacterium]
MKRSTAIYAALAVLLQLSLARAYQTMVPVFRHFYAELYGKDSHLPWLTETVLTHNWIFYVSSIIIAVGWLMALRSRNNEIAVHLTFLGMILFLILDFIHAIALGLPLIITITELE